MEIGENGVNGVSAARPVSRAPKLENVNAARRLRSMVEKNVLVNLWKPRTATKISRAQVSLTLFRNFYLLLSRILYFFPCKIKEKRRKNVGKIEHDL